MYKLGYVIFALLILISCGRDKNNQSESALQHSAWIESFNDSVSKIRVEMEEINNNITLNQNNISTLLPKFEVIDNPRFVEKYSVYKGWKDYDTGAKTGVLLRLSENSSLELIATLQGGIFDRISVQINSESLYSTVVPYDKALNYRIGNTNIVAFKGKEIDEICRLIANNIDSEVKFSFIGNKKQKTITLNKEQKEMISETFHLWECNNNINKGNLRLQLLSEKLKIYESRIQRENNN